MYHMKGREKCYILASLGLMSPPPSVNMQHVILQSDVAQCKGRDSENEGRDAEYNTRAFCTYDASILRLLVCVPASRAKSLHSCSSSFLLFLFQLLSDLQGCRMSTGRTTTKRKRLRVTKNRVSGNTFCKDASRYKQPIISILNRAGVSRMSKK